MLRRVTTAMLLMGALAACEDTSGGVLIAGSGSSAFVTFGDGFGVEPALRLRGETLRGDDVTVFVSDEPVVQAALDGGDGQTWRRDDFVGRDVQGLFLYADGGRGRDVLLLSPTDDVFGRSGMFDYTVFGTWVFTDGLDVLGGAVPSPLRDASAFVGGARTGFDMPVQGDAFYEGPAAGVEVEDGLLLRVLTGRALVDVEFDRQEVAALIRLDDRQGDLWGTIESGLVRLDEDDFLTTGAFSSRGHEGRLSGAFFGPNAREIGGTWRLRDGGNEVIGSFGGRR